MSLKTDALRIAVSEAWKNAVANDYGDWLRASDDEAIAIDMMDHDETIECLCRTTRLEVRDVAAFVACARVMIGYEGGKK